MDKEGKLTVKVPDDVPDPELILTPRGSLSAPTSACPSPVPRSRCLGKYVPMLFQNFPSFVSVYWHVLSASWVHKV